MTEAVAHIAREGRGRSRRIPFGYRTADGEPELGKGDRRGLVKHEREQRQLAAMLRRRKRGEGARRIAHFLSRRHGGNPRTGEDWKPANVASILRKILHEMDDLAAIEFLLERMKKTQTNEEFFASMKRK